MTRRPRIVPAHDGAAGARRPQPSRWRSHSTAASSRAGSRRRDGAAPRRVARAPESRLRRAAARRRSARRLASARLRADVWLVPPRRIPNRENARRDAGGGLPEALATRLANENDNGPDRACGSRSCSSSRTRCERLRRQQRSAQTTAPQGPRPRTVAEDLAARGDVADALDAGDVCTAAGRADELLDATTINNGQVPQEFQEDPRGRTSS